MELNTAYICVLGRSKLVSWTLIENLGETVSELQNQATCSDGILGSTYKSAI